MNHSTQERWRTIRFSPESYTTTSAVKSLKKPLKQRVWPLSADVASSSPHSASKDEHQAIIPYSNLTYSDVFVGDLLGSGAYASVYNVRFQKNENIRQKALSSPNRLQFENGDKQRQLLEESRNPDDNVQSHDENPLNQHLRHHHHSHHLKHHYHHLNQHSDGHAHYSYALKCLQQDKLLIQFKQGSPSSAKIATTGFLMECKILYKIAANYKGHPNVIGLIGISDNFASDPSRGFLVLEKVSETLHEALVRWRGKGSVNCKCSMSNPMDCNNSRFSILPTRHHHRNKRLLQREQGERIRLAALGVARALQFLHEHRIIYRGT
jgi:serine/threonine protein kinase